jgi:phosphoribosylformylglycinamidine cyclo-ligase
MYAGKDFDVAGTIVGVVDEKNILNGKKIRKGDLLIGLPSTGLHTNGYSLARRALLSEFSVNDFFVELGCTIGKSLLSIHRSYYRTLYPLLSKVPIKGMSHITGGGIEGNTMRVVPRGLGLAIDWNAWKRPPIFKLIQKVGNVPEADMRRTFNLGVGMILIVGPRDADAIVRFLRKKKEQPIMMGEIKKL